LAYDVDCQLAMKQIAVVSGVVVFAAVMASAVVPAYAQTGSEPAPSAPTAPEDDHVSPTMAALLSLGGTAASFATIGIGHHNDAAITVGAIGAVVMPSAGRWYAHSTSYGGLITRGIGAGMLAGGLEMMNNTCLASGQCNPHLAPSLALVAVGSAAYLSGALLDIVHAPFDARAYNARRLKDVALVPMIQPERHSYGLGFSARF
jgi:hypothetical protein